MFDKKTTYKIAYDLKTQVGFYTGTVIEENKKFITIRTLYNEIIIINIDKIIKAEVLTTEVKE